MKNQAHLYSGDSPLGTGCVANTVCGSQVQSVHIVRAWDNTPVNQAVELPPIGLCKKCLAKKLESDRRYLYIVREDRGEVAFCE